MFSDNPQLISYSKACYNVKLHNIYIMDNTFCRTSFVGGDALIERVDIQDDMYKLFFVFPDNVIYDAKVECWTCIDEKIAIHFKTLAKPFTNFCNDVKDKTIYGCSNIIDKNLLYVYVDHIQQ